jgi:hypothetical protein
MNSKKRHIHLVVDENIYEKVRRIAFEKRISINQLFKDLLEKLLGGDTK